MTPFGLPPNLIIIGPGGYTPKDFLRFGGALGGGIHIHALFGDVRGV